MHTKHETHWSTEAEQIEIFLLEEDRNREVYEHSHAHAHAPTHLYIHIFYSYWFDSNNTLSYRSQCERMGGRNGRDKMTQSVWSTSLNI